MGEDTVHSAVKLQMAAGAERLALQSLQNEERNAHHFLQTQEMSPSSLVT